MPDGPSPRELAELDELDAWNKAVRFKDRFAMLSPRLLELLRDWYRIARPAIWLFPGRDPVLPMTTRQFNRAVHAAVAMAEIKKRVTPYTLRQATHLLERQIAAPHLRFNPSSLSNLGFDLRRTSILPQIVQ